MQKFIFIDNKKELADAWNREFAPYDNVEAHGPVDLFSFEADACVSPANSFGFMDGGIDLLYSMNMGWHVSANLRNIIRDNYDGELLVGQALLLDTGYARFPKMIVAPTMRVPGRLNGTPNVYLAAKAMFLLAMRNPSLETIVCPGLGTGTGGVTPDECARVMRMAYEDWYLERSVYPENLSDVFGKGNAQKTKNNPIPGPSEDNMVDAKTETDITYPNGGKQLGAVYYHDKCVFQYCPDPEKCKSLISGCKNRTS